MLERTHTALCLLVQYSTDATNLSHSLPAFRLDIEASTLKPNLVMLETISKALQVIEPNLSKLKLAMFKDGSCYPSLRNLVLTLKLFPFPLSMFVCLISVG